MTDNNDRPRRFTFVIFSPMPPTYSCMEKNKKLIKGFRNDYSIGETIRSLSHMIIEPTVTQATQSISSLSKHDFAFLKRSDGSYTYAILAYRSMVPKKGSIDGSMEECMVFVVVDDGSTKRIRKRDWIECVRLISTEG